MQRKTGQMIGPERFGDISQLIPTPSSLLRVLHLLCKWEACSICYVSRHLRYANPDYPSRNRAEEANLPYISYYLLGSRLV